MYRVIRRGTPLIYTLVVRELSVAHERISRERTCACDLGVGYGRGGLGELFTRGFSQY